VNIRTATLEDAADIVQLIQELAAFDGETSPLTEEYTLNYLRHAGCFTLLAEIGGQPVGLLTYQIKPDLYHSADTCYIAELVVKEGYRKHGVGSTLMQVLFERLEGLQCVEVSVSTMMDNAAAIRFYTKHGLTDQAVLLEKHLD
jgi:ribosomal protein S18 acetylase RimI-like enzyme